MNQSAVDALLEQMQSETTSTAQALDQASQTAQEIAAALPPGHEAPAAPPAPIPKELQRLLALEVPVIVQLGRRRMTVSEVMRFSVGAIIEFSKAADEELELLANNKTIGKGQAVKVGENFGIKISTIGSIKETIRKLGTV